MITVEQITKEVEELFSNEENQYELNKYHLKTLTLTTKFCEALKKNTLTSLVLQKNNLGGKGAWEFAEALSQNRSLRNLDLSFNNLGDVGATALAKGLKENVSLTSLNLYSNYIRNKGAISLADALKRNQSLTHVNLGENIIGTKGAQAFAATLRQNHNIISLSLLCNRIDNVGANALIEVFKQNYRITKMNLKYNDLGKENYKILLSINTLLEDNKDNQRKNITSLETIHSLFNKNNCTELLFCYLGINNNSGESELDLDQNSQDDFPSDPNFEKLIKKMKENLSTSEWLYAGDLRGTYRISKFFEVLKQNISLKEIYFKNKDPGGLTAKALFDALEQNHSLTSVSLDVHLFNSFTTLASALKQNTSLTMLNLGSNYSNYKGQINVKEAKAIANALKHNASITSMNFGDFEFPISEFKSLANAIKTNTTLMNLSLDMYTNRLDVDENGIREDINKMLNKNKSEFKMRRREAIESLSVLHPFFHSIGPVQLFFSYAEINDTESNGKIKKGPYTQESSANSFNEATSISKFNDELEVFELKLDKIKI